jgi:hypothetical protein
MSDSLLAQTDIEEALSRAYVHAVSGMAGYTIAPPDFDRDGVDMTICAGGEARARLDVQLKATVNLPVPAMETMSFPLKRGNYDLLRLTTMVPRILVVLALPKKSEDWLSVTPDELILRHCAYWTSLKAFPETENQISVTVKLLQTNRFDVSGLQNLMARARTGSI